MVGGETTGVNEYPWMALVVVTGMIIYHLVTLSFILLFDLVVVTGMIDSQFDSLSLCHFIKISLS